VSIGRALALACVALAAVVWPVASSADHVDIEAVTSATLAQRSSSTSWLVKVTFNARCLGDTGEPLFFGNLNLVDDKTGDTIYLGGVSSAAGKSTQVVGSKPYWRSLHPRLRIACTVGERRHGSDFIEVAGAPVLIPPLDGDAGGDAGGGGGGGGGSGDNSDPTDPLRNGGCRRPVVGTNRSETLSGSGAADVIFGRGGNDRISGRPGTDCLIGGTGNDVLRGEDGDDRLTGGSGADTLVGGPGTNAYDSGSGNDVVDASNGRAESVRCGSGKDTARVDKRDRANGCERVTVVG
jgi:Ca2+-binding RTX toxin-like protein